MDPQAATSEKKTRAPRAKREPSNSLKTLGYTIEGETGTDSKNKPWKHKVTSARGTVYFMKEVKPGELRAFRTKESKETLSISGLYAFTEKDGDLIGAGYQKPKTKAA